MVDIPKRVLVLGAFVVASALVLLVSGIGCPIRFVTGISCPGCGLTRAWLSALQFDFAAAMAYHPLFWLVPPTVLLAVWFDRLGGPNRPAGAEGARARWILGVCLGAAVIAFVALWLVRLSDPADAGLLRAGALPQGVPADIVNVRWLRSVEMAFRRW